MKNNKLVIEAGDLCLIPEKTPHSYGADADNPWTIYWFHLTGKQCNDTIQAIAGVKEKTATVIKVGFSEKRDTIFRQMVTTFLKGYSASNLIFANLLLNYYLASYISPEEFQQETASVHADSPTDKAIRFMQQNLSRQITLDSIARSAHLSVSFFSRKFKADTGYAPIEYFNHLRIQKACQLMHFSKLRINEVASQIGIDDPFYFSRLFKQQMGISPLAYRKNECGNLATE